MKKLTHSTLLFILVFLGITSVKAQNTFPLTGNAGIGTTSPASPLDIRVTGTASGLTPMALSTTTTNGASGSWAANGFSATQTGANPSAFVSLSTTGVTAHPAGSNILIFMPGSFIAQHGGAGTVTETRGVMSGLLFTSTSGNVTNAECFYATSGIIGGGTSTGTITNGYGFYMTPFTSNVLHKYGFYINDATANNYLAGSMSIGTTSSSGYQLAVDGSAIFTKAVVKLFANWPDYVFKKDYLMPPLDSLAAYIRANNHLPEIPSAEEVKDKGIDVGANQAVLLKKIEELTLYLIRQNEVQQAQQQEIELLKKKVTQLSSDR
jgi:hypothetical protein